jgi:hypothetical protein
MRSREATECQRQRFARWTLLALAFLPATVTVLHSQETSPPKAKTPEVIEDNSFFVEEAYNQEERVVQHISGLQYFPSLDKDLLYTFTQEWPLSGRDHQISYTIPLSLYNATHPGGVADILLNYRYQVYDDDEGTGIAPRLSVILPTGNVQSGLGGGATGVQVNIPASKRLSNSFVAHLNAGFTYVPNMKDESVPSQTIKHSLTSFNLGASIIWLTAETYNVMLEYTTTFSSDAFENGTKERSTNVILSPGFRYAINLHALQIVPGIGIPIMMGGAPTRIGIFLYLSFEHPY